MAVEVEEHIAMAKGRSIDRLAHLAWLRIDGHYAVKEICPITRQIAKNLLDHLVDKALW